MGAFLLLQSWRSADMARAGARAVRCRRGLVRASGAGGPSRKPMQPGGPCGHGLALGTHGSAQLVPVLARVHAAIEPLLERGGADVLVCV